MHWTLLACLALAVAFASGEVQEEPSLIDTESVRQVVHSLLSSGELISEEALDSLADGYSGSVREYLDIMKRAFSEAKSVSELYVRDQLGDLQVVADLLKKLEKFGGASDSLGDQLVSITKGPSLQLLRPFLSSSSREGPLRLSGDMETKINDVVSALETFLASASEELTQELLPFAKTLPNGHVKNFFVSLHKVITELEQTEDVIEIPLEENALKLTPLEIKTDKLAFDQILNKQNVRYVIELLDNKDEAIAKIDALLKRDYESEDLPKILRAIRDCLN